MRVYQLPDRKGEFSGRRLKTHNGKRCDWINGWRTPENVAKLIPSNPVRRRSKMCKCNWSCVLRTLSRVPARRDDASFMADNSGSSNHSVRDVDLDFFAVVRISHHFPNQKIVTGILWWFWLHVCDLRNDQFCVFPRVPDPGERSREIWWRLCLKP
jgi:hypothetical protein